MEKVFELFKNPFEGLSNYESIQVKCAEIARELFSNYHLACGNETFRFAEIEFYYYDRAMYLKDKLFYHLSGIDICFDSHYKNNEGKFGGILIRAIKDNSGLIIAGPLNCKDEILNACKNESMPKLIYESDGLVIEPVPTYRSLGKTGTDKIHDRLCFFDGSIEVGDWNPIKDRFFTSKGTAKPYKGSYDTSKFSINK